MSGKNEKSLEELIDALIGRLHELAEDPEYKKASPTSWAIAFEVFEAALRDARNGIEHKYIMTREARTV